MASSARPPLTLTRSLTNTKLSKLSFLQLATTLEPGTAVILHNRNPITGVETKKTAWVVRCVKGSIKDPSSAKAKLVIHTFAPPGANSSFTLESIRDLIATFVPVHFERISVIALDDYVPGAPVVGDPALRFAIVGPGNNTRATLLVASSRSTIAALRSALRRSIVALFCSSCPL